MQIGSSTPWGKADYVVEIAPDTFEVTTPSHGGVMVRANSETAAQLTDAAKQVGWLWDDWYCYEEDADYAVVEYELAMKGLHHGERYLQNPDGYVELLRGVIERWFENYANAIRL